MLTGLLGAIGGKSLAATCDSYTKLLLHMDGDNNGTTFTDEVGHSVTRNGDTKTITATKKFGTASGYFDATGDYLSIANSTDFNLGTGDFTIDFWINPHTLEVDASTPRYVFCYGDNSGSGAEGFELYLSEASTLFAHNNFANYVYILGGMTKDAWHHIAVVRSGTTLTMYIDGNSTGSTVSGSDSGNISSSGTLDIGRCQWNANRMYDGYIDEMRISKGIARWLNNFTVSSNAYSVTNAYDSACKLLLHMDGDNNGTTFTDEMGKTATVHGDTKTITATKKFGSASAYFDGTGDYLSFADSADWDFGTGDYTIDFWINTTQTGSKYLVERAAGDYDDYCIQLTNGTIRLLVDDGTDTAYAITLATTATVNDGNWHHIAVSRASGRTDIFIDGTSAANSSTSYNVTFSSALEIGMSSLYNAGFIGYIDEFRVTKGVARWTTTFVPPTAAYVKGNAA